MFLHPAVKRNCKLAASSFPFIERLARAQIAEQVAHFLVAQVLQQASGITR
jgi:hypothetical protein